MSHTRTVPSMEELNSQRASWLMTSPVTLSLCPLKRRTILMASTSYLYMHTHRHTSHIAPWFHQPLAVRCHHARQVRLSGMMDLCCFCVNFHLGVAAGYDGWRAYCMYMQRDPMLI